MKLNDPELEALLQASYLQRAQAEKQKPIYLAEKNSMALICKNKTQEK